MAEFYGARVTEKPSTISAPVTASTGVMAFGTAPVHQVGGPVNEIVLAHSYAEAVSSLGYSEDWEKYTLCEVVYSHFQLYGAGPLLLVNVLDPATHKTAVAAADKAVSGGQVDLGADAIPASVVVKKTASASTAAERGTDYDVFYSGGTCIVEVLSGGSIASASTLNIAYDKVDFNASDLTNAVIGGFDTATGKSTGLELADLAYFKTKIIPDILIAPGFSDVTTVAAVLAAKAKSLSVVFRSFALVDLPVNETVKTYTQAVAAKSASGSFQSEKEAVCWPKLKLGDKIFHFSTQMAGQMAALAAQNGGIPSDPPSNKTIQADAAVLHDETELTLGIDQANYVRGQGIVTALNFIDGMTAWGASCACAPGNSDPKDTYISSARMVNYIANSLILTYWQYIDRKMDRRLATAIADAVNIWLNGLTNQGHLLGGRCEIVKEENPDTDLVAGIVRPHLYLGFPGPAQTIDFVVEYDAAYLTAAFA